MTNSWNFLRTFYSTTYTQSYLNNCYENLSDGEKLSFQNSDTFIYYIDHSRKYYNQAKIAPYELQPVLLFYGMIQLMKAVILTVDPNYPETTQVLAHGVSTRKRKKSQYEFLDDEVKIQKNGLITYFSEKLFRLQNLEGEKYKMVDLLKKIAELHGLFNRIKKEVVSFPLKKKDGLLKYQCEEKLLDHLSITASGLTNLINAYSHTNIKECRDEEKDFISIELNGKLRSQRCSPFLYDLKSNTFSLPTNRDQYSFFPEIIAHYLLLYNLSMVCRYETDWWGELFHHYPSNDYPFIIEFLHITLEKVPYYISMLLGDRLE